MSGIPARITSERQFSDLWERTLDLRPDVVDGKGHRYEVIFPGVKNQGAGPDFTGAVLRRGDRTFGGDVELHLEQSGWKAHGHNRDPAYNGVVLQVVLRLARNSENYASPPTATVAFKSVSPVAPRPPNMSPAELEDLGMERFVAKSGGFRLDLDSGMDSGQILYQGTMEAMGYARNRKPFLALAKAVPLSLLARLREEPRATAKFAAFAALVTAGNVLERVATAERGQIRRVASSLGVRRRLSAQDWSMFRVRPHNSPVSRMRAMAHIVADSVDEGLSESIQRDFDAGGADALVKAVSVAPGIGRGLALTIVANAVLPSLYAIQPRGIILSVFREMPSPPADSVTRGIKNTLGIHAAPMNAAQHSGLHALAKSSSWPGGA